MANPAPSLDRQQDLDLLTDVLGEFNFADSGIKV